MKRNIIRLLVAFGIAVLPFSQAEAKRIVVPEMYMFGFAASFNDTIVHFTNISKVDSVWVESKNNFLLGRNYYSHQLKDFLATKEQMPQRTCITMYATSRAKAEKKLLKLKRLYTQSKDGKQHFDVRYINDDAFRYKSVNIREYEESEEEIAAQEELKNRKKAKGKKKNRKSGK